MNIDGLQDVWDEFGRLMKALKDHPSSETYMQPMVFKARARQWAKRFREVTFDEDVIPYIHCKYIYSLAFNINSEQSYRFSNS